MEIAIFVAVLVLAYVNGANDNFKGVSTLYGGGVLNFKEALAWSSFATATGCLAAVLLVGELAKKFGGAGLVGPALINDPIFPLCVAASALSTVALATRLGFPISTTHALLGALAGMGFSRGFAEGFESHLEALVVPLLLSPVIAAILAFGGWVFFKKFKTQADLKAPIVDSCLCASQTVLNSSAGTLSSSMTFVPSFVFSNVRSCEQRGLREIIRLPARDLLHLGSAFLVCSARGLNDAPKIAGLLLLAYPSGVGICSYFTLSMAMVLGGVFHSHKIAERMSVRVSKMSEKSSVWSNLVTSTLVLFASKHGVPVSTTHTSVGSIAGTGRSEGTLQLKELSKVMSAWLLTLPCAFVLAYVLSKFFQN